MNKVRVAAVIAVASLVGACTGARNDSELAVATRSAPIRLAGKPAVADLVVAGQVVDDRGQPVPDVHVRIGVGDVVTDGGGRFIFDARRSGRYEVAVPEVVHEQLTGVARRDAGSLAVVVPGSASHEVLLVVRRVGAVAWSRRVPDRSRDVAPRASVQVDQGDL